jgi:hypothetical protein
MANLTNTMEERIVVRASDLKEALKEVSDGTNPARIIVIDDVFFAYFSDEKGNHRISDTKKAAYYGISDVSLVVSPETVKELFELADELIKTNGEERSLIVFYIRQTGQKEGRYRIDTLNSTLEDEIKAVNKMYRNLMLNS